jgi:hypothetical protein
MTTRYNIEIRLAPQLEATLAVAQAEILRRIPGSKSLAEVLGVPQRWHVSLASFEGTEPRHAAQLMRSALQTDPVQIDLDDIAFDPPNPNNPRIPEGKVQLRLASRRLVEVQRQVVQTLRNNGIDVKWPPLGSEWKAHCSMAVVPLKTSADAAVDSTRQALSQLGIELPLVSEATNLEINSLGPDSPGVEVARFASAFDPLPPVVPVEPTDKTSRNIATPRSPSSHHRPNLGIRPPGPLA